MLAAFMDQPCIVTIALFAQGAKQLPVQDLREADDGVKRRTKFVAHIGKELRLSAARALRLVAHAGEFGFLCLALGDVPGTGKHAEGNAPLREVCRGRQRISTQNSARSPDGPAGGP